MVAGSSDPEVEPSLISDPAFAKLTDLKHAETCKKVTCSTANCPESKLLLKHVESCIKAECKYQDCGLARIVLAHSRKTHANSPFCPICRKQEIIRRMQPGKGPRGEEETEGEENEEKVLPLEQYRPYYTVHPYYVKTRERKLLGVDRNNDEINRKMDRLDDSIEKMRVVPIEEEEEIKSGDALAISRARMRWILHAKDCRWDYCCKRCYWLKSVIAHVKECPDWECKKTGCIPTKELIMHHNNCRPLEESCKECGQIPEPGLYSGKDYFADLNGDVLRRICGFLNWNSLDALRAVNYRVYNFFQYPREIRGIYKKKFFDELRIEKLADGSTMFRFFNLPSSGSGYAHIFSTTGVQKCFRYTAEHGEKARQFIISNFGILEHWRIRNNENAIQLSPEFYFGLELALEKFEFKKLFLGSISIDDQLKGFITTANSSIDFSKGSRNFTSLPFDKTSPKTKNAKKRKRYGF